MSDSRPGGGAAAGGSDDVDERRQRAADRNTPGRGITPEERPIEPDAPEEFGLVQAWWGDGKGKTTAALGMGARAVGHGHRVHMLQFMKGGADSVEAVRGEYNAIAALPGFSYENTGHYGWHGMADGSADDDHERNARAGLERARDLVDAAADADLEEPIPLDAEPEAGVRARRERPGAGRRRSIPAGWCGRPEHPAAPKSALDVRGGAGGRTVGRWLR